MSAHTKGKARIAIETAPTVVAIGKREICECYEDGEVQGAEDQANAQRIVACWNVCEGISTAEVTRMAEIGHFALIAELTRHALVGEPRDRDELIKAATVAIDCIRAAIARVKP